MNDESNILIGRIDGVLQSQAEGLLSAEQALDRMRELYRIYNAKRQETLEALEKVN